MLEPFARTIVALLLACALLLPGCAHYSHASRQQAAYARYVKKFSNNRVKQRTKFKKVKMPAAPASSNTATDPATTTAPQSVSSSEN